MSDVEADGNSECNISVAVERCRIIGRCVYNGTKRYFFRIFIVFFIMLFSGSKISAQLQSRPMLRSTTTLDMFPGFININDLNIGAGLGAINAPYAADYFGITTILGYQFNQILAAGAGTGINLYSDGQELPVFADFRIRFYRKYNLTAGIFGDGGVVFNLRNKSELDIGPRIFINPGIVLRYDVNYRLGFNLSAGVIVQQNNTRNSYLNIKLGFTVRPGSTTKVL